MEEAFEAYRGALGDLREGFLCSRVFAKGDPTVVCFIEAKILSDASGSVTNDPLRNSAG
jgi:hypothetical protein